MSLDLKKLILTGLLLVSSVSICSEAALTPENYKYYYVKINNKKYIIEKTKLMGDTLWRLKNLPRGKEFFDFDEFIFYLESINVTLVRKDSIKFKVEDE